MEKAKTAAMQEATPWFRSPITITFAVLGMVFAAYQLAGVLTMLLANIALVVGVWCFLTLEVAFSHWIKRAGLYRNSIILFFCAIFGLFSLGFSFDIKSKKVAQVDEAKTVQDRPALPGLSVQSIIAIKRTVLTQRHYIVDTGVPGGERISEYISPNEVFTYAVTDASGEEHSIEAPLGTNGVPFEEWVYLTCEVGVDTDWSFMRIVVNGSEVAYMKIPEHLNFTGKGSTAVGNSLTGDKGGPLLVEFMAVYKGTLSNAGLKKNELAAKKFKPNLYDHPPFSVLHPEDDK